MNGRDFERRVGSTEAERLLALELTQDHQGRELYVLRDDVQEIKEAQAEAARARKARAEIKAEFREARKNAMAVVAFLLAVGTFAIGATRFWIDTTRPHPGSLSATTVPAPK